MPSRPTAMPIAAPAASSQMISPVISAGDVPCGPCWLSSVTASTDGGSFSPDSPSRIPESIGGSGSRRSTENTAAASVGARTAPTSSASRQPRPSSQCVPPATTTMLTATPTVASAIAAGAAARACAQLVVRPPSARISTRAPRPRNSARPALLNRIPMPASPRARPSPRKTRSAGSPALCASRATTIATSTVAEPASRSSPSAPAVTPSVSRRAPEVVRRRALPEQDDGGEADQPDDDRVDAGRAAAGHAGCPGGHVDRVDGEQHGGHDPRPALARLAALGHPEPQRGADQPADDEQADRHVLGLGDLGRRQVRPAFDYLVPGGAQRRQVDDDADQADRGSRVHDLHGSQH